MSPKQFENQIRTFLKHTETQYQNLIRKDELEEHDTPEWMAWDNDAYKDDVTGFLGAMSQVLNDYRYLVE